MMSTEQVEIVAMTEWVVGLQLVSYQILTNHACLFCAPAATYLPSLSSMETVAVEGANWTPGSLGRV